MAGHRETIDVRIREMQESDLPLIKKGIGELFFEGVFEEMRLYLVREKAEHKAFEEFLENQRKENRKYKICVAVTNDEDKERFVGFVSVAEVINPEVRKML